MKSLIHILNCRSVYYGHEKIIEKSIGNSLKLQSYLIKYEKEVVRLTTIYYKPEDKWILFVYQFDVNIKHELKESAKLNSLHE